MKPAAPGGLPAASARWPAGRTRHDVWVTAGAAAALLAWDASGWDLPAARLFGTAQGFALRSAWWASTLLHDGGRWLAWGLLAALVVTTLRAPAATRRAHGGWLAVMAVCVLGVPALKRVSTTSCPWDLAEFGGSASHVSHWALGWRDGGPGHCFPSGHAVAAFAFFGVYFMWRDAHPRRARAALVAVLAAGALFGAAQLARGAHLPSHTGWSAWLCWAVCVAAAGIDTRPQ